MGSTPASGVVIGALAGDWVDVWRETRGACGPGERGKPVAVGVFHLAQLLYAFILCVMRTCSIMEAQHNLGALLQVVESGEEMLITRRRKPVAKLVRLERDAAVVFPDFQTRARRAWNSSWRGAGTDDLLEEGRGER